MILGAGGNNLNYSEFMIFLKNLSEKYFYGKVGGARKNEKNSASRKVKMDYSGNGKKNVEEKPSSGFLSGGLLAGISGYSDFESEFSDEMNSSNGKK